MMCFGITLTNLLSATWLRCNIVLLCTPHTCVFSEGQCTSNRVGDASSVCMQSKTSETEERGELVAVLIGAAIAFGVGIYATMGADKAAEYFAGYLLEQSLSVDNLFVFVLIFDYFKVDQEGQDKVSAGHASVIHCQYAGAEQSSS